MICIYLYIMVFIQQEKTHHTRHKRIPTLQTPTQRLLYIDPIREVREDKTYKLHTTNDVFIFVLSKKQPHIIFLMYNGNKTRLNKLLKQYTGEEHIKQQFIKLLEEAAIIQDKITTLFIIEAIYIFSYILNINLQEYMQYNEVNNLISYYFMRHTINEDNDTTI